VNGTAKRMKRKKNSHSLGKTFSEHVPEKGLVSKIYI
jgi:hypothetical protein